MSQIKPYYEKYQDLPDRWNIDKQSVNDIIRKYEHKLIEELISDEPWRLDRHFRDNRTNDEYIYDLLEGEMIEEFVVAWFTFKGCDAKRVGTDSDGKIQRSNSRKITTKPDLLVDNKYIEIQVSRKGRLSHYHVKETKGKKILNGLNSLMMIVDNEYFVIDKELLLQCELRPNPAWGGKMCYEIPTSIVVYKSM